MGSIVITRAGNTSIDNTSILFKNRAEKKLNAQKKPLIQAPLWATGTAYILGNVRRHSNGQLMVCCVAGTSDATTEPVFLPTAIMPEATGTCQWAWMGVKSDINADGYPVPVVTVASTYAGSTAHPFYSATRAGAAYSTTVFAGGADYVDGIYTNVPLTGGTGTGAVALSLTVAGGAVTGIKIDMTNGMGTGYLPNDILTADNSLLGGAGSGFQYKVLEILTSSGVSFIETSAKIQRFYIATQRTSFLVFNRGDAVSSNPLTYGWTYFEFVTDDPKPGIYFANDQKIKISVDGYPLEESILAPTAGGNFYKIIDFSGIRQNRTYRIETPCTYSFLSINLSSSQSVIFKPESVKYKGLFFGDSYGATISPIASSPTIYTNSRILAQDVLQRIGISSVRNLDIGGTGYLNGKTANDNNTVNQSYNCKALMINNALDDYLDVISVVFAHGQNDKTLVLSDVCANAVYCWNLAAQRYPNAVISIFGPWSEKSGPDATHLAIDNALINAFNTWSYERAKYHSICQDASGSWTTGTGRWGSTTGTGNADFYVGADTIHPSIIGREYLINRMSKLIDDDLISFGL
jgi:hypothetical protein